jgi:HAD superfamily hydrolase (TIGR01484 family)
MRYHVLATDYDGTLAHKECVSEDIIESLKKLKASGRKLILVTGRELEELQGLFPEHKLFDLIVAENGAVIYQPATLEEKLLGERPPENFIQKLKADGITPLSVGRVIVATWEPNQTTVLNEIKAAGIEYQVIFNKGAVMVLPPGINKAKGLLEAVKELGISPHNTVAIGDAENDNAMLQIAECAVAVDNALPQVKDTADWTTVQHHGMGVAELIDRLVDEDLRSLDTKLTRHYIELGTRFDGQSFQFSPYWSSVLLSGTSGSGKTTLTAAFLEKLINMQYQFCLIDPEGDYLDLPGVIAIGDANQLPLIDQVMKLLSQPKQNAVVCTLAIPLNDRPAFFKKLMTAVMDLRNSNGHPHFTVLDEAHHLVPKETEDSFFDFPENFKNFFAITTQPDLINRSFLKHVNLLLTMGDHPDEHIKQFAEATGFNIIQNKHPIILQKGEMLVWREGENSPVLVRSAMPSQLLQRHKRKYATGDMDVNSFYFKGPENKLNLKAQNLITFIQLAEGVDDETWLFHLRRKDYSTWFRKNVNDDELARKAEKIEEDEQDPSSSRKAIIQLINERYTAAG